MESPFPFWLREIFSSSDDIACVLDDDLRISDCNPCWDRFADDNGGVGISLAEIRGRNIFEFIPMALWDFYKQRYADVRQSAQWLGFDYECSTPDILRLFHMSMKWVAGCGIIVVNSRLSQRRGVVPDSHVNVDLRLYRDDGGVTTMCAHCRKAQRRDRPDNWDWVPQFIRDYAARAIEHALCPPCRSYFYPSTPLT